MFKTNSSRKVAVVTGGAGFLGSHLSDRLLSEGFRVIAVDNLITGSTDNIAHLARNQDFTFIRHNVSEFIFIPGRVDYVLGVGEQRSNMRSSAFCSKSGVR
jgi:dTDP-glucose 4,6-dehydratase